jgi:hypothetical protein
MQILLRRIKGRKKAPNWTGIAKEVERTLDRYVKPRLLEYGERVTANWEHKPAFKAKKRVTKEGISVYVYPTKNKDIWTWVSRGTGIHGPKKKPYRIPKTGKKLLAFPSVYAPKTKPRGPSYGGSGESSGPTHFAMYIKDHPGIKGRHFEEAWARWAKTWFRREMENAMRRGARRA